MGSSCACVCVQVVELLEPEAPKASVTGMSSLPVFALRLLGEFSKPDPRGLITPALSTEFVKEVCCVHQCANGLPRVCGTPL